MTHKIKFCAIALLAVMFLARVAGAADSQFYKGKTLTILINYATGSRLKGDWWRNIFLSISPASPPSSCGTPWPAPVAS